MKKITVLLLICTLLTACLPEQGYYDYEVSQVSGYEDSYDYDESYDEVEQTSETDSEDIINLSSLKAVTVTRVVDGDTFIYKENGQKVRVRMTGIDTPESVAPEETGKTNTEEGVRASDYVKELLTGATVYLEYDVSQYDKYDRELAYVYLEDGRMVQEILLEMGYAETMTIEPNTKYADRFAALESKAKEEGTGFFGE